MIVDACVTFAFLLTTFNWSLAVTVLLITVVYVGGCAPEKKSLVGISTAASKWQERRRNEEVEIDIDIDAILGDSLLNAETVKYYGNEQFEANRYKDALEK